MGPIVVRNPSLAPHLWILLKDIMELLTYSLQLTICYLQKNNKQQSPQ